MAQDNLISLHDEEEAIRTDSLALVAKRTDLTDHLALIQEAMNVIWAFTQEHVHNSDDELTFQFLGIRLFNAAAVSIKLALAGYYIAAATTFALLAGPALAQSSQNTTAPQTRQNGAQSQSQSPQQGLVAAQKIQTDLQKQGFTDVKVVSESFVVQGKSPDGDPIVMTIGARGMSVFEAMNASGSESNTVGSDNSSSNNSSSNSTSSPSAGRTLCAGYV
ncbi:hypothetical protein [Bradyrhizobium sp.]|uniref:hypothetical protein n=1 Tax=Bradyrhizobium sp. TaxID=376 RepID=UPI0026194832|nr:hypothetical protein [Bradyrhizobium sp.]